MTGTVLMNIEQILYYQQVYQLLNWWYAGNVSRVHTVKGGDISGTAAWNAGYFDATTGELTNPVPPEVVSVERIIYQVPQQSSIKELGCNFAGETMALTWDGTAAVSVTTGVSSQNRVGFNRLNFTMDGALLTIKLVPTNPRDPPRNILLYQTRYAANVAKGERWNPDWLGQMSAFGMARLMNFMSTNNSWITDIDQTAGFAYNCIGGHFGIEYTQFTGPIVNCDIGPKGGIHPEVIASLSNAAKIPLQVCVPLHATDTMIRAFATHLYNTTDYPIIYELSNECWNFGFFQASECAALGAAMSPPLNAFEYYGYRAAVVMSIVREVYKGKNAARWQGAIATQVLGSGGVTPYNFKGAHDYLSGRGLEIKDVFDALYVVGYTGDTINSSAISGVIQNTTTQLKFENSPNYTLDPIRGSMPVGASVTMYIWFSASSGYSKLSGRYTATVIDEHTLSIPIDTTRHPAFVADGSSYVNQSAIFDLIARSTELHKSSPLRYPTVYQYFNEQLRSLHFDGTCSFGIKTGNSNLAYLSDFWSQQLAIAKSHGLKLRQYEGGTSFGGDAYLTGAGGNAVLTPFVLQWPRSLECAEVLGGLYEAFTELAPGTAEFPSKFELAGPLSSYGPWASVMFWPTEANGGAIDDHNPPYLRTVIANAGNRSILLRT